MAKDRRRQERKQRLIGRLKSSRRPNTPPPSKPAEGGGTFRYIFTRGHYIPLYVPPADANILPLELHAYLGISKILCRWLDRRFPDVDAEDRAQIAALAAWSSPLQVKEDFLKSEDHDESDGELIKILDAIHEEVGSTTQEDLINNPVLAEVVMEGWAEEPPFIIGEKIASIDDEKEREKELKKLFEYTMYLHRNFVNVHPMHRAEIALAFYEHGYPKPADFPLKPTVQKMVDG